MRLPIVSVVALAGLSPSQGTMVVPSPCAIRSAVTDSTPQQLTAVRAGHVLEARNITGHYIRYLPGTEGVTRNLASMAESEVLLGELTSCRSFVAPLPPLGQIVWSVFSMKVEEAFKGLVPSGRAVSLVVRGGHSDLGNGDWFETRYFNFTQPRVGRRYVVFVTLGQPVAVPDLKGEAGVFVQPNPRHGLYTSFELTDGKVVPLFQSESTGNVAGANRGRDEAGFLAEIRDLVKRRD